MSNQGNAEVHSPDKGCELHPLCLDCPEVQCYHDYKGGRASLRKAKRDREVRELTQQGVKTKVLAAQFGVHRRTINKAVKQSPPANADIGGGDSYGVGHGRY